MTTDLVEIRFTQYIRPNGKTQAVSVLRPAEIGEMYEELLSYGCSLDAEVLPDMQPPPSRLKTVYLTIEHNNDVVACGICPEGAEVPVKIDDLVHKAHLWLEQKIGRTAKTMGDTLK